MDKFQECVEIEIKDAVPKILVGKALDYTKKILSDMKTLLENGILEINNNRSEKVIKPFVIGRKIGCFQLQ